MQKMIYPVNLSRIFVQLHVDLSGTVFEMRGCFMREDAAQLSTHVTKVVPKLYFGFSTQVYKFLVHIDRQ